MDDDKFSRLKRPRHPMPNFIQDALQKHALMKAFQGRPAYQQNDYIAWITRAKRESTVDKRLAQMLDELEIGDRYMKMRYRSKTL